MTLGVQALLFINCPALNLCCINYNELAHNENSDYNGPDENLGLLPKVTDCIHSQETICWTLLTSIRDLALLESLEYSKPTA